MTASFDRLATETVMFFRSPALVDGVRGEPTLLLETPCTPPDTMDASYGFGFGLGYPHQVWTIYIEGDHELKTGDVAIVDDKQWMVKNVRKFPSFRTSGNTSYEIQLEVPESEIKVNR